MIFFHTLCCIVSHLVSLKLTMPWARMFALVAAALLILTQLGTALLRHPQRSQWLRQVRSRRRARTELSLLTVVCHLLDQVASFVELFTPHAKLNLEAAL